MHAAITVSEIFDSNSPESGLFKRIFPFKLNVFGVHCYRKQILLVIEIKYYINKSVRKYQKGLGIGLFNNR